MDGKHENIATGVSRVLQAKYAGLDRALQSCIQEVANELFSAGLISEAVKNEPSYRSIDREFQSGMTFKKEVSKLKEHCQTFVDILSAQGGPAKIAAESLAEEWTETVQKEFGILFKLEVRKNAATNCKRSRENESPGTSASKIFKLEKEEEVKETLKSLHKSFVRLRRRVREELDKKIKEEISFEEVTIFMQDYITRAEDDFTNIKDLDELFKVLHRYSDFLDCDVLKAITEEFIKGDLLKELQAHSEKAVEFRKTQSVTILRDHLRSAYSSPSAPTNAPKAIIHLSEPWENVVIENLYTLMKHLLPKLEGQSLTNHIKIYPGSVHIEYIVQEAQRDSLISHAQEKLQFMHLIGIFHFAINGKRILDEEENMNFTFNSGLLEAVNVGDTEAVSFLIKLGANIDYQDEEGKTALMNACENKYIEIVELLLEFNANLSLTTANGHTALIISVIGNSHELVQLLLDKDDKLLITELTTACKCGLSNIISLFMTWIDNLSPEEAQISFRGDLTSLRFLITYLNTHSSLNCDANNKDDDRSSVFSVDSGRGLSITTTSSNATLSCKNEVTNISRPYNLESAKMNQDLKDFIVPLRRADDTYMIEYVPQLSSEHQLLVKVDIDHTAEMIPMVPSPLQRDRWITTISPLNNPWGIALTKDGGYIIITEYYGNSVIVFDSEGRKVCSFGHEGKGALSCPAGITVTRHDRVLVVDQNNRCVCEFTIMGEYVQSVGTLGSGPLQFNLPYGIGVHPISNQIYVCDAENHRIQVLNEDMTFSHQIGRTVGIEPGQFRRPYSIDFDEDGHIYVVDKFNKRVQKLSMNGNFLIEFGADHLQSAEGIAVGQGCVYVSDCFDHTIAEFTLDGIFKQKFGGESERYEKGHFKHPSDLAMDRNGYLYVCDRSNWRVQVF